MTRKEFENLRQGDKIYATIVVGENVGENVGEMSEKIVEKTFLEGLIKIKDDTTLREFCHYETTRLKAIDEKIRTLQETHDVKKGQLEALEKMRKEEIANGHLIKVNRIYWQCLKLLTTPKSLYRKLKIVAVDAEHGTVDFYFVGDPDRIFNCSVEVFLLSFGKTKKEASKKGGCRSLFLANNFDLR